MSTNIKTIKHRSTFLKVKDQGQYIRGKYLNLNFLEDPSIDNAIFVGYLVTKKLGNAVKRNKAKRILRELAKKVITKYGKTNSYYVLIAKNSIFNCSFDEKKNDLKDIIS